MPGGRGRPQLTPGSHTTSSRPNRLAGPDDLHREAFVSPGRPQDFSHFDRQQWLPRPGTTSSALIAWKAHPGASSSRNRFVWKASLSSRVCSCVHLHTAKTASPTLSGASLRRLLAVILTDDVRHVLIVFVADVFLQIDARLHGGMPVHGEGPGVGARIGDGGLILQVA
jgi:hypothetical protein